MKNELQRGDTILCNGKEDMLSVHAELMRNGVYTDWLDIKEEPPLKWRLTVTGIEKEKTE